MPADPKLLLAVPVIPKGKTLAGEARQRFLEVIKPAYRGGHSIQAIADRSTRSFGSIRELLANAPDVKLRKRGGSKARHRGADSHTRASGGPERSGRR
ncbi:hypothetical protein DKG71_00220 [Streptomyces sp. NEAU-S7GS2]|nr:hypothetical protein DKG71_00220 [Streptomyces sp. NEAU-S7GS2]